MASRTFPQRPDGRGIRYRSLIFARALLAACWLLEPARAYGQTPSCIASACDDGNPCTNDLCDPSLGCVHANNSSPCSDGNACSAGDACSAGACIGGGPATGCTPCQAAAVIPPEGGTFVGTTSGTSTLAGSCANTGASPERVYEWTPVTSGVATIQTCGAATTYDSVVYLRSGTCAGPEVACNDDTAGCGTGEPNDYHGSSIRPTVTAGQTYYIVVDGYGGRSGTFALTVVPPAVCGNGIREGNEQCDGADDAGCATRQCTTSCTCVPPPSALPDLTPEISDIILQRGVTVSSGDVAEGCAETTSGVDLLRFTATSRNIGPGDLYLGNPQCPSPCVDHPLAVCGNPDFVCSPAAGHNHPHYSNYARYELLNGSSQAVVVGHKQGFCLSDTACSAPRYNCGDQGISAGCADEYTWVLGCQYLDITGVPAGTYSLRMTLDPFGRIAEANENNNVVSVPVTIPPPGATTTVPTTTTTLPASCPVPTVVPPQGGTFTGTTSGASSLTGCVTAAGAAPERVFQWTPAVSGAARIETCSAAPSFDTVLYVRTGGCNGLQIACNDDTSGCTTSDGCATYHGSRVTPTVTAGVTYHIVVDGYAGSCGGASGSFRLTVTPPGTTVTTSTIAPTTTTVRITTSTTTTTTTTLPGACATAIVIPAGGGSFNGTTAGGSTLAGSCGVTSGSPEKVYKWIPNRSGVARIHTCDGQTRFSTVVYVRRGSCQNGAEIACSAGACATTGSARGSRLTPTVTAGETYWIVVDGSAGRSGSFKLRVSAP